MDLGQQIPVSSVFILIGALFVAVGITMPRLGRNWMMGIRNPWTLTSESVWHKTHRMGGKVFIVLGILTALLAFLPSATATVTLIMLVLLFVIGINAYSWRLYATEALHERERGGLK
jgi:uncharacterized membrane protein